MFTEPILNDYPYLGFLWTFANPQGLPHLLRSKHEWKMSCLERDLRVVCNYKRWIYGNIHTGTLTKIGHFTLS